MDNDELHDDECTHNPVLTCVHCCDHCDIDEANHRCLDCGKFMGSEEPSEDE